MRGGMHRLNRLGLRLFVSFTRLALLVFTCAGDSLHYVETAQVDFFNHDAPAPPRGLALSDLSPSFPRPRVLLWIPIHISEPTTNLEAMVACTFTRHAPSLVGEAFDVLVTLAGNASDGRAAELASIVRIATAGVIPVPPTVRTEFVYVEKDVYDKDSKKGRRSSYAGPNTVFYTLMASGYDAGDQAAATGDTVASGNNRGPSGAQARGTGLFSKSVFPTSGALYSTHIAPYAFVQVLETDCCALAPGWLDVLLEPMLESPHILMAGSRTQAACYSSTANGGDSSCKTTIAPHLRLHINGNAMYRVGPALQDLVRAGRDEMLDVVPFDLAMFFVRKNNQSHVHDNPRMYSVGALVDGGLWDDAAYYGLDECAVFVHAPRRLRVGGVRSIAHRADRAYPTVAVVVAPTVAGGTAEDGGESDLLGGISPGIDVSLLRNCHASLRAVRADRNLVFIALTWPAFVEASRIAPFHVLLANGTQPGGAQAWPDPITLAVQALTAAAALTRAGLQLLVVGTDAVAVVPGFAADLLAMDVAAARVDGQAGAATPAPTVRLLQTPNGAAPLVPVDGPGVARTILDVGAMQVPAGDAAAAFLEHWATGLLESPAAWRQAAHVAAAPAACEVRRWTDCFWRGAKLTVDWLPAEAYSTGASYWGPFWTDAARELAAHIVSAGVSRPEFRLRQTGLWRGEVAPGCANYSAVARLPVPLGPDLAGTHRALTRYARFLQGIADGGIMCAVLPGFVVATTGNAVPFDVVLRDDVVADLARGRDGVDGLPSEDGSHPSPPRRPPVRFYPTAAALDVPYEGFIDLDGGRRLPIPANASGAAGAKKQWAPPARLINSPAGTASPSPPNQWLTHPPAASRACTAFGLPDTACFAPNVAAAIIAAARALPADFWCVTDPGRSSAEAAVLALEGRLHEVDGLARQLVDAVSAHANITILLTGAAWRATAAARAAGGDHHVAVITLADLPGVGTAADGLTSTDPITRLVRPDTAAASSAAASPWADVIEYAICQAGLGVTALPGDGVPGLLAATSCFRPSTLLPRLAAHIPPAILQEDLHTFTNWLARPDRPGLGGRWVRTRWRRGGEAGSIADGNASVHALLTPGHGVHMITTTARHIRSLDASLGFVPGLPPPPGPNCTGGTCPQQAAWSSTFGPEILHGTYAAVRGRILPPTLATLTQPEAAFELTQGGGVLMGSPSYEASQAILSEPRVARAVAVMQRVLDDRSPLPSKLFSLPPGTMWMLSSPSADRLARLKHFAGEKSVVVLEQ